MDAKLIEMSEDKSRIQPVPETHIMSRALVRFSTMKILLGLNGLTRLNQVFALMKAHFGSCLRIALLTLLHAGFVTTHPN